MLFTLRHSPFSNRIQNRVNIQRLDGVNWSTSYADSFFRQLRLFHLPAIPCVWPFAKYRYVFFPSITVSVLPIVNGGPRNIAGHTGLPPNGKYAGPKPDSCAMVLPFWFICIIVHVERYRHLPATSSSCHHLPDIWCVAPFHHAVNWHEVQILHSYQNTLPTDESDHTRGLLKKVLQNVPVNGILPPMVIPAVPIMLASAMPVWKKRPENLLKASIFNEPVRSAQRNNIRVLFA